MLINRKEKIQDWILKSENGFRVSLLNRSIKDLSDRGASIEPKNPPILRFFSHTMFLEILD